MEQEQEDDWVDPEQTENYEVAVRAIVECLTDGQTFGSNPVFENEIRECVAHHNDVERTETRRS